MSPTTRRSFLKTGLAAGAMATLGTLPLGAAKRTATDTAVLGRSNMEVTRLAFGTGTDGGAVQAALGQQEFTRLVRYAYDHGIRFFETAEAYQTPGMLGEALKGLPRDSYHLMNKVTTFHEGIDPQAKFDELLRTSQTEYFDIMLLHWQHTADWPETTKRWQDGILGAQQRKIIRTHGASVHGLPALRQMPGTKWLDVGLIRINHNGARMAALIGVAGDFSHLCRWHLFDAHAGDAIAIHLQNGEAPALVLDGRSGPRNLTQPEEEESGQGFETGIGRDLYAVLAIQVADASGSVQFHVIGLGAARFHLFVVLVFDPADNLFQHVFHGQHADDGAELIDDHGQVRAAGAELIKHLRSGLGFGHEHHRPQQAADAEGAAGTAAADGAPPLLPDRQQILIVQQADDLLGRSLIHREARMLLLDHGVQHLVESGVAGNRNDIVARHHDFAHRNGAQVEDAMDHVLLRFGQVSQTAAAGDNQLEFLGGMYVAVAAAFEMERARDGVRRALDHHHEGQHGAIEEQEQRSGERGQPVSLGDGQILGHYFAQHHVEKTDGEKGEEEAQAVKVGGDDRRVQGRGQPDQNVVDGVLAGPPQAETGQGDTHLGHGKQTARVG